MKKIDLSKIKREDDFLIFEEEKYKIVMSTAEKNRNFNRNTKEGINELEKLKDEFNIKNVIYTKQIHSDIIFSFQGQAEDIFKENEGDAIISNIKNTAIGVFTADCVPVILVDSARGVCAAIHSGWKGTYNSITSKTISKLINEYGATIESIKVYIGAHIRSCCYEVSEELREKFIMKKNIDEKVLFNGRNLSMEEYILKDLRDKGINENNIYSVELCTHCNDDIKLYSYRKSKGEYGRLFSFIILN